LIRITCKHRCSSERYFTLQYYKVKQIVKKYLPVLNGDAKLREVLEQGCKFVTRKAKTVGNILSPSEVNRNVGITSWLSTTGTFKCGATRCITCEFMFKSNEFISGNTKRMFKIKDFINCNSILTCTKCNIQYVGCTSRKLKCRMREHINQIVSRSPSTVVSRHLGIVCNDGDCSRLRIQGIEKITPIARGGDLIQRLLYREAYWIFTLETRQPLGLNLCFDISCHT
ncbi:hypothetical protein XELAEV_18038534mg, partial [Xenopus laevis]